MGMCFSCNSLSCHHVLQGQQQLDSQQYENYLRQVMEMQQIQKMQQEVKRLYILANSTFICEKDPEPKKSNKLLLLLR